MCWGVAAYMILSLISTSTGYTLHSTKNLKEKFTHKQAPVVVACATGPSASRRRRQGAVWNGPVDHHLILALGPGGAYHLTWDKPA